MEKQTEENTATVGVGRDGMTLYFAGNHYDDWRHIDDTLDDDNFDDEEYDILRCKQFLQDIETIKHLGCEFIIDLETAGHEHPIPVHEYVSLCNEYFNDILKYA